MQLPALLSFFIAAGVSPSGDPGRAPAAEDLGKHVADDVADNGLPSLEVGGNGISPVAPGVEPDEEDQRGQTEAEQADRGIGCKFQRRGFGQLQRGIPQRRQSPDEQDREQGEACEQLVAVEVDRPDAGFDSRRAAM